MAKKLTFSVDDATVLTLRKTAERLRKPQSMVVREAVAEYAARAGRLTETERRHLLKAVDQMIAQPPSRPETEVAGELRAVRQARRQGGRRHPAE
ncbi:MAG: ribbon-helix-helix protein, CopG family [Acidobacteria bacterium]|nr:ribbon-helix-helix protein, CopG family [Acidobacteriota bacterium]